jgi:nitrogen fixation protein FixH
MNAFAMTMPAARRSRWIPWAFVAFFGVVLAANAIMIVIAITTWPGLQTQQAY